MPITPQMAAQPSPFGQAAALNANPSRPFLLFASPDSAMKVSEGLDKPTWVPGLVKFELDAGVELVEVVRRGGTFDQAIAAAIEKKEREGMTLIPPDTIVGAEHLPEGVAPGHYYREHATHHIRSGVSGVRYQEAWETLIPQRRASAPPKWHFHRAPYNRWLVHLMREGVIPAPDQWARDEVLKGAKAWADAQHNIKDATLRADRVKDVEAGLKELETAEVIEAGSKPKTRRGGK